MEETFTEIMAAVSSRCGVDIRDLMQGGRRRNSCSVVDVLVAVVAIRATYASRVARITATSFHDHFVPNHFVPSFGHFVPPSSHFVPKNSHFVPSVN